MPSVMRRTTSPQVLRDRGVRERPCHQPVGDTLQQSAAPTDRHRRSRTPNSRKLFISEAQWCTWRHGRAELPLGARRAAEETTAAGSWLFLRSPAKWTVPGHVTSPGRKPVPILLDMREDVELPIYAVRQLDDDRWLLFTPARPWTEPWTAIQSSHPATRAAVIIHRRRFPSVAATARLGRHSATETTEIRPAKEPR